MEGVFGERIRQARLVYGMSQVELARRIGVSKWVLSDIELGKTHVYAERIRDVARMLRVDARYLLGLIDEQQEGA